MWHPSVRRSPTARQPAVILDETVTCVVQLWPSRWHVVALREAGGMPHPYLASRSRPSGSADSMNLVCVLVEHAQPGISPAKASMTNAV
jgi:hypothetical protein